MHGCSVISDDLMRDFGRLLGRVGFGNVSLIQRLPPEQFVIDLLRYLRIGGFTEVARNGRESHLQANDPGIRRDMIAAWPYVRINTDGRSFGVCVCEGDPAWCVLDMAETGVRKEPFIRAILAAEDPPDPTMAQDLILKLPPTILPFALYEEDTEQTLRIFREQLGAGPNAGT